MIRLVRGPEPEELKKAREKHLRRLRDLIDTEKRDPSSHQITGYALDAVRDSLHEGQNKKCCYCEHQIGRAYEPIEHYRPKARVDEDGETPERPGYWWLAYSWTNLLYSCGICNGYKGSKFPLRQGCAMLAKEQPPPGGEEPFLLNPYDDDPACDPVALIEFRRTMTHGKDTWEAFPRDGDERARRTIDDIIKLNRDALVAPRRDHVIDVVIPKANNVKNALRGEELRRGDRRPLWNAYAIAVGRLLSARSRFSALSYDALRTLVPDEKLVPHLKRPWPRPPAEI